MPDAPARARVRGQSAEDTANDRNQRLLVPRASRLLAQPLAEQDEDGGFFWRQGGQVLLQLVFDPALERLAEGAVEVGVEDCRMDVALAADGAGVAEPEGDGFDRRDDVLLGLRFRVELAELLEGLGGQDRSGPGPEVLGGELLAEHLAQVGVDVLGGDAVELAVLAAVLEEVLPRQLLAALDDAGQPAVA